MENNFILSIPTKSEIRNRNGRSTIFLALLKVSLNQYIELQRPWELDSEGLGAKNICQIRPEDSSNHFVKMTISDKKQDETVGTNDERKLQSLQ